MRCAVSSFPARLSLLGLAVVSAFAGNIIAAEAAPDKDDQATPRITFTPEAEAKFTEFLNKAANAKRRLWSLRMQKEIEGIAKVTGLGEEGKEALETPAEQAADACIEGWSAKLGDFFRREPNWDPEQLMVNLDDLLAQAENYAAGDFIVTDYVRPVTHPSWVEAVRRTLTAAQAVAWDNAQAERKRLLDKEIDDFLKPSVERTREQHTASILARSAEMKSALSLPNERAEKLDALAKSVAEKTTDAWRTRAKTTLFYAEDDQRRQVMKGRQFNVGIGEREMPSHQPAWKDGVAEILSADELKRLQAAREERKSRRARAMGQVLIAELDGQIAFSASQRQQLQPIAELLVQGQRWLFPEDGSEMYINFAPQMFFAAAAKAPEEKIKPILDPLQWKRWQDLCNPKRSKPNRANLAELKAQAGGKAQPPTPSPEPETVENAISDFLHEKSRNERKRLLAAMTLKAEDAARVAGLSAGVTARLQTAARGAAEEKLDAWKLSAEENVRANLGDGNPQTVKQRLASMDDYYFQRVGGSQQEQQALWDNTVKVELSDEQRAAWQKQIDERNTYEEKSIVSALMAEFDRKNLLTMEEWNRLEPFIAGVVKEYGRDIAARFSSPNSAPWYLQNYTMFIPFVAVSEKDLKVILTKEQWERWLGSNECTNSTNYWANIERTRPKPKEAK